MLGKIMTVIAIIVVAYLLGVLLGTPFVTLPAVPWIGIVMLAPTVVYSGSELLQHKRSAEFLAFAFWAAALIIQICIVAGLGSGGEAVPVVPPPI